MQVRGDGYQGPGGGWPGVPEAGGEVHQVAGALPQAARSHLLLPHHDHTARGWSVIMSFRVVNVINLDKVFTIFGEGPFLFKVIFILMLDPFTLKNLLGLS